MKQITKDNIAGLTMELSGKTAQEIVGWVLNRFGNTRLVVASSLSVEDQVLTYMVSAQCKDARFFILDTGRHFPQTYATMERTMEKIGIRYEIYAPESADLEQMVHEYGPDLFCKSIELRKLCCKIRKVKPLTRVLSTADAWICGLRREQAVTRSGIELVEWDEAHGIVKVNPLYNWTEVQVWDFIRTYDIPYNSLQDKGFRSIGCAPCTRAVASDDDIRAGRWWWEEPEHKECGLHNRT